MKEYILGKKNNAFYTIDYYYIYGIYFQGRGTASSLKAHLFPQNAVIFCCNSPGKIDTEECPWRSLD